MYNLEKQRTEERKVLFNRICDEILGTCDIRVYENRQVEAYQIGAAYSDGDFLLMDKDKEKITIYLNHEEKMTFTKDDNFLPMMNCFLQAISYDPKEIVDLEI